MIRRRVLVHGHVQGVFFRDTTRRLAVERGVAGWVRNRRDGTVEAEIEGASDKVDEMLAWMAEGPPGSRVESATVTDASPLGDHGFEVRPTA